MSYRSSTPSRQDHAPLLHNATTSYQDSPDFSPRSTPILPRSPNSLPQRTRKRPGYTRLASVSSEEQNRVHLQDSHDGDLGTSLKQARGLGISRGAHGRSQSPDSQPADEEERDQFPSGGPFPSPFASSTQPWNHKAKIYNSGENDAKSIRSRKSYADFTPHMYCASREQIWKGASNHIYIALLVLSIFSTIFSGIFFGIAIAKPRYERLTSDKGITISNAAELSALFARLIDLSFVTVFMAFIGQVVSRRAFNRSKGYGVTLAEISLRSWVMQPGQIFLQPNIMKYAGTSLFGFLAFVAALSATLYTTAATA